MLGSLRTALLRPRCTAVVVVAMVLVGCVGTSSPPLPREWVRLQAEARPFAGLYRLDCCGRRGLLTTIRADGASVDVTVAAPTGAALLRAWVTADGGWLFDGEAGCVRPLTRGELPIGEGLALPLDPMLSTLLLSGLAPPDAVSADGAPGWIVSLSGPSRWMGRVGGAPPRIDRVVLTPVDGRRPVMEVTISDHRLGRVPAMLRVDFGGDRLDLSLVSWRGSPPLEPPGWLAGRECGTRP